ncbi:hypothetical protein H6F75_26370 [Nodosilinea sp. FACHB-131]|uniref:hypothetical protein n=1 Tax=Cyanophyceae TaxID=3028117 RepID=UPI001685DF74|nr:hypothetical protein [Nodosilinea sp. FACHB-131]MBD1877015.1 hypothetical protein [Nodosilinea sp. FACHB-131]
MSASTDNNSDESVDEKDSRNSFSGFIAKWGQTLGIIIAVVITPAVTLFNTIRVEILNREVDLVRYFQKEIKDSLSQLAGEDPEQSRVAFASLYSLANDYDKKRILISIALSRDSDVLDEAISYLILSENKNEREKILDNNPSLREAVRRIEAEWVKTNYAALESVKANADIRPQVTNGSTQLFSLFSSNDLEGWMLLGRFSNSDSLDIDYQGGFDLEIQKEISKDKALNSEGTTIDENVIRNFENKIVNVSSPIYVRQAPPSNLYDLSALADSSGTSIVGVLCQGSKVKILDYKPVKPGEGNYTLWGKVSIEASAPCYSPNNNGFLEGGDNVRNP